MSGVVIIGYRATSTMNRACVRDVRVRIGIDPGAKNEKARWFEILPVAILLEQVEKVYVGRCSYFDAL